MTPLAPESNESLEDRLRRALLRPAAEGETLTYRELVEVARVPPPHTIHKVTLALEGLAREDHEAGRPLLAALAVGRSNHGLPGKGFFELLQALGRYDGPVSGPEAKAHHRRECEAVYTFWGDQRPQQ